MYIYSYLYTYQYVNVCIPQDIAGEYYVCVCVCRCIGICVCMHKNTMCWDTYTPKGVVHVGNHERWGAGVEYHFQEI